MSTILHSSLHQTPPLLRSVEPVAGCPYAHLTRFSWNQKTAANTCFKVPIIIICSTF